MSQDLADFAATQLRVEMARRQINASGLAAAIGVEETWVRRRMRCQRAITMADLERIAAALDLPPSFFVAERVAA